MNQTSCQTSIQRTQNSSLASMMIAIHWANRINLEQWIVSDHAQLPGNSQLVHQLDSAFVMRAAVYMITSCLHHARNF